MANVSVGALVPSVTNNAQARIGCSEKDSATESSGGAFNFCGYNENNNVGNDDDMASGNGVELDKEFLCPICMQIIKDAFLTSCGHTFCYMCIITHLNNKHDCPCCAHYLTNNHLFPNFLLNKMRVFKGHTNEKNFVGLTVNNEYIACGSETNEVFVYHKAISKPVAWHRFGSPEVDDADDDAASYFISAVCWKSDIVQQC